MMRSRHPRASDEEEPSGEPTLAAVAAKVSHALILFKNSKILVP
jgi:hypothetical protein